MVQSVSERERLCFKITLALASNCQRCRQNSPFRWPQRSSRRHRTKSQLFSGPNLSYKDELGLFHSDISVKGVFYFKKKVIGFLLVSILTTRSITEEHVIARLCTDVDFQCSKKKGQQVRLSSSEKVGSPLSHALMQPR